MRSPNRTFRNLRVAFCLAVLAVAGASASSPRATTAPPSSGYVLGPDDQILIRALEGLDTGDKVLAHALPLRLYGPLRLYAFTVTPTYFPFLHDFRKTNRGSDDSLLNPFFPKASPRPGARCLKTEPMTLVLVSFPRKPESSGERARRPRSLDSRFRGNDTASWRWERRRWGAWRAAVFRRQRLLSEKRNSCYVISTAFRHDRFAGRRASGLVGGERPRNLEQNEISFAALASR